MEYEEILLQRSNPTFAKAFFDFLINSKQVETITIFYYWRLITIDPDDNKFVDAAIATGADYIVTEDKHFDLLKDIPFPPIKVINLETLKSLLEKLTV